MNSLRGVLIFSAVIASSQTPCAAEDQPSYPAQTIKFIVPAPAGGLPDTIIRIVGRRLQDRIGQPVVVENRSGASAGIATAALIGAAPDGYTFLVNDGAFLSVNPLLYKKLAYDPKDVIPVAMLARAPLFLAVHMNVPIQTMQELIEYVKANPGKLNYGSIGIGSFHHLSMEAINASLNLRTTHIPYKGSGESVSAFLGGHIDLLFSSYAALRGAIESNKAKLVATNGAHRSPLALDIPTIAEFIPGFELAVIQGIFARAGTSEVILQRIAAEAATILKEPEVLRQFATAGIEPAIGDTGAFKAALQDEADRVKKVIQAVGLAAQ